MRWLLPLFWHQVLRFLCSAPFLLFLGACQTSEIKTAAASSAPSSGQVIAEIQAPVADVRPVIVFLGDSLSAGFGVETGSSFPDFVQKLIDAKGYKYRVVNQGISGDTTSGGLARVGMATKLKPAVAVLELGGNDGLRGLPIEETKANLEQMAAALAKSGAKVVIAGMTLPPNYGRDYVRKFEQMYVDLAERNGHARIKFLLEGVWDQPGAMQADGIHPTVKGNEMVAKLVFRTIEPLLKK